MEENNNQTNNQNQEMNVLTNEEIQNITVDESIVTPVNIDEPQNTVTPSVEVTPNNTTTQVENKPKPKKKKSFISKLINLIIWLAVLGWAGILVYDFINVLREKEPMFCLEKTTETTSDGTVNICEGVGYKVFNYDYGSLKALEFAPFWNKPKTAEELK